jgi:tripartite-type tricarboxylate transporter receptor subunit TctC
LTEDIIEVWSECRIRSSRLAEFGGKGERKENRLDPVTTYFQERNFMKTILRIFTLVLMACALNVTTPTVWAQSYPNRLIQFIIPIPAGGGGDVNGRLFVEELIKILGQQIMVVNKPGASDTLGTDALAKSKKDGYTLGYTSSAAMVFARVTNPESVPYDPVKDFDPLGSHTFFPLAVAVQAGSPWNTKLHS